MERTIDGGSAGGFGASRPSDGADRAGGRPKVLPWLRGIERKLDEYGAGAWVAAALVGLIVFAPIGLLIIFYIFWSGRMGRMRGWGGCRKARGRAGMMFTSSGNAAFDSYREETMRRLEEEREAFDTFMQRLREAKDKAEFEQFMAERARGGGSQTQGGPTPTMA